MRVKPPQARVIRDDLKLLASAPRRVPISLWLRVMFGGWGNSTVWFILALLTTIVAVLHVVTGGSQQEDEVPAIFVTGGMVAVAFPVLVGLAIYNARRLRLLRKGDTVQGILVKKYEVENSETSTWFYVFAYEINDKKYEVELRMENREKRLEDDPTELMVYLPSQPDRASPVDHLPGYPTIDDKGQLIARDTRIWPALLLPCITLVSVLVAFLV